MTERPMTSPLRSFAGTLLAALLTFTSAPVHAVDWHAGGDIAHTRLPVAGRDYTSWAIKLRAGATHRSGWGVELQGLTGLGEDEFSDIEIGIDNTVAAFVRYEYPTEADFRLYAMAGYAWTSLSIDGPGTDDLDDSYGDFVYGVGMQEKLRRWQNTTAILEFNNYFSDDNVDFWSISAGLRYEF